MELNEIARVRHENKLRQNEIRNHYYKRHKAFLNQIYIQDKIRKFMSKSATHKQKKAEM